MSDPTITYVPADEPLVKTGEYDGDDMLLFGFYRVQFEDRWTALLPHTGFRHTVSEEPVWLEGNPHFCDTLIEMANRMRPE